MLAIIAYNQPVTRGFVEQVRGGDSSSVVTSLVEKGLVEDARLLLSERGFANSGVMLTRVIDENGSRQYTLTVHHGRISKMSDEDRQFLMAELEQIVFEDDNSIFFHKFFENH